LVPLHGGALAQVQFNYCRHLSIRAEYAVVQPPSKSIFWKGGKVGVISRAYNLKVTCAGTDK